MPKFFVQRENIGDSAVNITGADANHISRVLRMRKGDTLCVCDGNGMDYACEIAEINPDCVSLKILEKHLCDAEPSVSITLFMALPKSDKMEYVIQKCVELGVTKIVPFASSRCVVKLSDKDKQKKTERWQKISCAAAKQSGRGIIPEVEDPISFAELLKRTGEFDLSLFCYECEEENSLKTVLSENEFKNVCVVVGPEGGFDKAEVQAAEAKGFKSVSLGKRILRCETAPGCAVCAILYQTGNL